MKPLLSQLVGLCLLRIGPQDLPYSPALTRAVVLSAFALDCFYVALLEFEQPLPRLLLSFAFLLVAPWWLLGLRRRRERYPQTLAALAGSGLLFTLAFLPVALLGADLPPLVEGQDPSREQLMFAWTTLGVIGWKLAVNGHILRHALDWPRLPALLLAFGLFLLELGLDRALFGVPA